MLLYGHKCITMAPVERWNMILECVYQRATGTKKERDSLCVQMLPYKLFPDSFIEVVMVSEWASIIYAQHQEKHGATDRQISGWQEKEIIQLYILYKLVHTHTKTQTHLRVLWIRVSLLFFPRVFLSSAGVGGRTRRRCRARWRAPSSCQSEIIDFMF